MLNTVVRQIAFHNFETQLHDRRAKAELTADEISDIRMETQRVALGPAIRIGDDYRSIWGYVPILSIRRFTCTPMRLVTAWLMRYGRNTSWHREIKRMIYSFKTIRSSEVRWKRPLRCCTETL